MKEFAEIFVNSKIYTYAVPAAEQTEADIGCAVDVTLRGKPYTGYILRFVAKPEFQTLHLKKILSKPNFDESLVKLTSWIADYYKCFPETALKLILPANVEVKIKEEKPEVQLKFRGLRRPK